MENKGPEGKEAGNGAEKGTSPRPLQPLKPLESRTPRIMQREALPVYHACWHYLWPMAIWPMAIWPLAINGHIAIFSLMAIRPYMQKKYEHICHMAIGHKWPYSHIWPYGHQTIYAKKI